MTLLAGVRNTEDKPNADEAKALAFACFICLANLMSRHMGDLVTCIEVKVECSIADSR